MQFCYYIFVVIQTEVTIYSSNLASQGGGCLGWGEFASVGWMLCKVYGAVATPFIVWLLSGAEMPNIMLRSCNKRMPLV